MDMKLKLLIVDDSRTTRKILKRCFEMGQVPLEVVHEAEDGVQALEVLGRETVDVVITDLNMPNMDGEELISQIRQHETLGDLPIILVSTEGSEVRLERIKALGISGFVHKPLSPEKIKDAIMQAVGEAPVEFSTKIIQQAVVRPEDVDRPLLESKLVQASSEVLGNTAFLGVITISASEAEERIAWLDSSEEDADGEPESTLQIFEILFEGPILGGLQLAFPQGFALEVAANMLGLDEDDGDVLGDSIDAIGELLNIICGNLLPEVWGTDVVFKIGPPTLIEDQKTDTAAEVYLDVEGHPVTLSAFTTQATDELETV